jgi:outer membrane protein OmpA-like peptidoglycan-associated protein
MPIQIAKVTLKNGRVEFSDRFVKPNYSATVTQLGGSVKGLSSAPDTLADLDLRGNYASNAPVQITARFNPLTEKKFLDLQAKVSDIDLVDLSPYSGKFAGYNINKGKLSLDTAYKLQDRQLTAQNRLMIDQLTFGDKVESPDATQLPVQLAIALLKNNRGQIDIELPIEGSLDDPQFSVGGLIFKVIGNLFVKAVTSPFALLGSLFGDSQELSQLGFAPGRASLDETAVQKLQTLSKAMREREGLTLEITAGSDSGTDPEGLRRALLERAVLSEKRKDMTPSQRENTPLADMRLDSSEYATYLTRAYQQAKFPKPRNGLGQTQALPVEEMEKLMLANLSVGEDELRTLATRRAQVVQGWLVEQGQVPLSRIFLLPVKLGTAAPGGGEVGQNRVSFSLR